MIARFGHQQDKRALCQFIRACCFVNGRSDQEMRRNLVTTKCYRSSVGKRNIGSKYPIKNGDFD